MPCFNLRLQKLTKLKGALYDSSRINGKNWD